MTGPHTHSAWARFRSHHGALAGLLLAVLLMSGSAFGPWLAPYDPTTQFPHGLHPEDGTPLGPTAEFWLGTDAMGRDELTRLLHGGQASMKVAVIATSLALVLGVVVGLISGYFGGALDTIAMRTVDIVLSVPFLLIAIAVQRMVARPSMWTLYVLLGALSWTSLARVTRSKVLQTKQAEFIQAARALGMSHSRIVLRHVIPHVMGPAIVIATMMVADMILVESAMSFLGLGVPPPQSSWGSMLSDSQALLSHSPRLVVLPGAMIVMTVMAFNLLGEGLRDALDPKQQG
jgi:peptide/nickel transport system permease protein